MTTWLFDGTSLPDGTHRSLRVGAGEPCALPGWYAVPGLVDAHCHLTVDSDERGPLLVGRDVADNRMRALARHGVTAVRDCGGDRAVTLSLVGRALSRGPEVVACGRFLAPQGRYFPRLHDPVAPADLVAAVEAEIDDGATWVKLIGDFPSTDAAGAVVKGSPITASYADDSVAAVVEAAHKRGARVAAHTNGMSVGALVRAGVDSIEHGTVLTTSDLEILGARGGAWTPTLCASVRPRSGESAAAADRRRDTSRRLAELLPVALECSVRVLTGSDVVGSVVDEIALLTEHGVGVEAALTAASSGARDYLRCGSADDLVTYDDDPRERPEVLRSPAAVVMRGQRVH